MVVVALWGCVVSSFASADYQYLRVSVSSFMDSFILATRTLATFNDWQSAGNSKGHAGSGSEQHGSGG